MSFVKQKHLWQTLCAVCITPMITVNAFGAVKIIKHSGLQADMNDMSKDQIIATLKNDIKAIDEQMAQCKQQKTVWTAATVVGGVGIVGTGIGAIVQDNQIQKKKSELKNAQEELRDLQW